jgi:hypothetical protein
MNSAIRVLLFGSLLMLIAVSAGWTQSASVVFYEYPESIVEGEDFEVEVDFSADLHEYGLAARVFLEVIDADTGEILELLVDDDGGDPPHEGPNAGVTFETSVTGASSVYFNAYISPIEMNSFFIDELESYPCDGSYPYRWTGNGVTHDIYYKGSLILSDNRVGNVCYCSGITYQVFMDGYANYNDIWGYDDICGMSVYDMIYFRRWWYGWYSLECAISAIKKYKVGYEIPYREPDKVIPGDQVQLWRRSGSGHSCIFIDWARDEEGEIIGLTYWSTQRSTNGIGYNTEYFKGVSNPVLDHETRYARIVKPIAPDDWTNRYDDANTAGNVTTVIPAEPEE